MKNLQVRVGEDEVSEIDRLADDLNLSRSETARSALREGMRKLQMDRALARYLNLEFTLSRAAQSARVTIHEMARAASEKGIPFFRYSLEELRRDPERVVAESEGRSYVGLLGLLLAGVDRGIVASNRARQILRRLVQSGFRLAIDLYDEAMEELGKDR